MCLLTLVGNVHFKKGVKKTGCAAELILQQDTCHQAQPRPQLRERLAENAQRMGARFHVQDRALEDLPG